VIFIPTKNYFPKKQAFCEGIKVERSAARAIVMSATAERVKTVEKPYR
jgi:hypothetical protein